MKNKIAICYMLISQLFYSQNSDKVTLFNKSDSSVLEIKTKEINTPSGGTETAYYKVNLKRLKNNEYSYHVMESSESLLYSSKLLQGFWLKFKITSGNDIEVINKAEMKAIIKNDFRKKYGKDTASFGDYFDLMCSPNTLIESVYLPFLSVLKNYVDKNISEGNKKVVVPCTVDTTIANSSVKIFKENQMIQVVNVIKTDSVESIEYRLAQMIKKDPRIKGVLTTKDVFYVPVLIKTEAKGTSLSNKYFIKSITVENRTNLGNPFDRINFIEIKMD